MGGPGAAIHQAEWGWGERKRRRTERKIGLIFLSLINTKFQNEKLSKLLLTRKTHVLRGVLGEACY